jgi:uncharacterized membrane protein (DUF2068 family)
VNPSTRRVPIGFTLIGAYKLITAALSVALGFGLFRLFQTDVRTSLEFIARGLRLDPENAFVHSLIVRLAGLNAGQRLWIEAGTLIYAILHVVEGIGILRGKRWGGILIILATCSLIPIECLEIVRRRSFLRIIALALNAAIVAYLIIQRGSLHGRKRPPQEEIGSGVRRRS